MIDNSWIDEEVIFLYHAFFLFFHGSPRKFSMDQIVERSNFIGSGVENDIVTVCADSDQTNWT